MLKLSTLWEVSRGRNHAILHIPGHIDLTPKLQLELARRYSVNDWIEPSFRAMLRTSPTALAIHDVNNIGVIAYHQLMTTMWEIHELRISVAGNIPPAVPDIFCSTQQECQRAWGKEWWGGFARHLLNPEVPLTGEEALSMLENLSSVPGMCKACLEHSVTSVRRKGVLQKENDLIAHAIQELQKWQL